jgi:hypothetical protein
MAITTLDGPVRSLNGFYTQGAGNVITLGATATLSVATHAGKILLVPATCAITLPAVNATADPVSSGPGADPNTVNNLGVVFTFIFTAASAGATAQTVTTASASDVYTGQILVAGTTSAAFNSTAGTIITLNATTTGGAAAGSRLTLMPYAANKWAVQGSFVGSGTVATPFS